MSPERTAEYTTNEQASSLDPSESPKMAENDSRRGEYYSELVNFKGVSSEPQQALHGNSILTEEEDSPTFKVCDNKGKISEQQTFKMRLEKPKAASSNGMSFENGAYKMDNLGQYFNTFIKVQVLALNHQCKVNRLTVIFGQF